MLQRDLNRIDVFQGLTKPELAQFGQALRPLKLPSGKFLLTTGEVGSHIYFIHSGTIRIQREQRDGSRFILNLVGAGDMLGEVCATDGKGHSACALTTEHCSLWQMRLNTFCQAKKQFPVLAENLELLLARRLRGATDHNEVLAPYEVERRVVRMLLMFAARYEKEACQSRIAIPLRLTQGDVAEFCNISRQHVNPFFKTLEKEGAIAFGARFRITVLSRPKLLKYW